MMQLLYVFGVAGISHACSFALVQIPMHANEHVNSHMDSVNGMSE